MSASAAVYTAVYHEYIRCIAGMLICLRYAPEIYIVHVYEYRYSLYIH